MKLRVTLHVADRAIIIRRIAGDGEARACAEIMATSEPWITLGRTVDQSLAIVRDPEREVYVAACDEERDAVAGFVIIQMKGAFAGYLQTVALREDWRSRGLGSHLITFAEERILRDSPNVFLCVSSFNHRARALYERLGYEAVGELRDYLVRGHSEWLLRKTVGPLVDFGKARGGGSRQQGAGESSAG
ncbi:MAG: N-acetyltransferase [Gemmatimonadaceae bacterium]